MKPNLTDTHTHTHTHTHTFLPFIINNYEHTKFFPPPYILALRKYIVMFVYIYV